MSSAIRSISIAKGYDPREYVLVAFGGAAAQLDGDRYNAATWYRRAVERMPDYSNEDWDTLWAFVGPQTPPLPRSVSLLATGLVSPNPVAIRR